jgi:hypothetical protein
MTRLGPATGPAESSDAVRDYARLRAISRVLKLRSIERIVLEIGQTGLKLRGAGSENRTRLTGLGSHQMARDCSGFLAVPSWGAIRFILLRGRLSFGSG